MESHSEGLFSAARIGSMLKGNPKGSALARDREPNERSRVFLGRGRVDRRCCWRGSPGSLRCSALVLIGPFWGRTRDSGFARWAYIHRRCCLDWWRARGGRSVGICGAVMRGVNTAYRKHPPRDDREKMMRYSGSVGRATLSSWLGLKGGWRVEKKSRGF